MFDFEESSSDGEDELDIEDCSEYAGLLLDCTDNPNSSSPSSAHPAPSHPPQLGEQITNATSDSTQPTTTSTTTSTPSNNQSHSSETPTPTNETLEDVIVMAQIAKVTSAPRSRKSSQSKALQANLSGLENTSGVNIKENRGTSASSQTVKATKKESSNTKVATSTNKADSPKNPKDNSGATEKVSTGNKKVSIGGNFERKDSVKSIVSDSSEHAISGSSKSKSGTKLNKERESSGLSGKLSNSSGGSGSSAASGARNLTKKQKGGSSGGISGSSSNKSFRLSTSLSKEGQDPGTIVRGATVSSGSTPQNPLNASTKSSSSGVMKASVKSTANGT